MITFEPFKSSDEFTMANFNAKLGGGIEQINQTLNEMKSSQLNLFIGSYIGNGKYHASEYVNTIAFDFTPKLWGVFAIVYGSGNIEICSNIMPFGINGTTTIQYTTTPSTYYADNDFTYSDNMVSWSTSGSYSKGSANKQLNSENLTYYYFALY